MNNYSAPVWLGRDIVVTACPFQAPQADLVFACQLGLISWQWSYTNGPVTTFDHIIFWSTIAFGMLCGSTFFNHGWYQPLVVLVMAPAFMVTGYTLR